MRNEEITGCQIYRPIWTSNKKLWVVHITCLSYLKSTPKQVQWEAIFWRFVAVTYALHENYFGQCHLSEVYLKYTTFRNFIERVSSGSNSFDLYYGVNRFQHQRVSTILNITFRGFILPLLSSPVLSTSACITTVSSHFVTKSDTVPLNNPRASQHNAF
jgi:hypothetical protein